MSDDKPTLNSSLCQESGVHLPQDKLIQFSALHRVTAAIRQGNLGPAFECVPTAFLQ
jgi:hypothetical protein